VATITHEQRSLSSTITSRKPRAHNLNLIIKFQSERKRRFSQFLKETFTSVVIPRLRFLFRKKESLDFLLDVVFKQRVGQRIEDGVRNVQKANDVVGNDRLVKGTEISTEVEIRICCVADYQDKHDEADEPCGGDFEAVSLLPMGKWMVKL